MKRKLCALTAFMLSASLLCSCGTPAGNSAGTAENADTPVKLTLAAADNCFGTSTDPDLQQAVVSLLESKTGTEIEAIIPPNSSYVDKIETMVSGNDIPDVFTVGQSMTRIPNYAVRGVIMPLDEYLEDSPLMDAIDPEMFDSLRVDGKLYHIPILYPKVKCLFLRTDIMEEYGINLSHTPTTEEFLTEMSKLKGTGIIPFSFPKWIDNFQFFMNSFGAYAGIYKNEEGKYVDGFQEDSMLDALAYIHELYASGVMDSEFITTENTTMREYIYTAKAACDIDYYTAFADYQERNAAAGYPSDVYPIYYLEGPDGEGGALNEAVQLSFAVSADCENPEKAIEVIESLVLDPEMHSAFFNIGVEGAHYTVEDGQFTPTEAAQNSGYLGTMSFLYDSYAENFELPFELSESTQASLPQQLELRDEIQQMKGPKYAVPTGISDSYDRVSASIVSTWQEIAAQVAMGSVTPEEGMKSYKDFWASINGDAILAELNGEA